MMAIKRHNMKPVLPLKRYEYSIPAAPFVASALPGKNNKDFPEHRQLLRVVFDFENGRLRLEGDRRFIMATDESNEVDSLPSHKERLSIKATILPSMVINLNDERNNELVFALEVCINDKKLPDYCSGLMIVGKDWNGCEPQWNIALYLYNFHASDCEIKFNLPVFVMPPGNCNN